MESRKSLTTDYEAPESMQSSARKLNFVHIWYKLAAPREVPPTASFKQREVVRRGKTASWILLVVMGLVLLPLPGAIGNPNVVITLLVVFGIDLLALYLNRLGHLVWAGGIAIFTIEAGILGTIFTIPGGFGPSNLPLLDLLTQAEIVAVALLAPAWVFVIMALNIGIVWGILHFSKILSPQLMTLVAGGNNIVVQALEIQIILAIFAFILVRSADLAILHLDRAEEIANLERKEIERQQQEIELKNQLDQGIQQILQSLQAFSNGKFDTQVPVSQENVLFRVAYSLNTLFARIRSLKRLETELQQMQQMQQELYKLQFALQQANKSKEQTERAAKFLADSLQRGRLPSATEKSGTAIDLIVESLRGSLPAQSDHH